MNKNLEIALRIRQSNMAVIPILKNKKPAIKWEKYQKELPSNIDIHKWFTNNDYNLAIVTGKISGICVVDIDNEQGFENIKKYIPIDLDIPKSKTPKGGQHWYFAYDDSVELRNNTGKINGCDLRAEGGYIIIPPSKLDYMDDDKHVEGEYSWINRFNKDKLILISSFKEYIDYIRTPGFKDYLSTSVYNLSTNVYKKDDLSTNVYKLFQKHKRDDDLFHIANVLAKGGACQDKISQVIRILALNCEPPFSQKEAQEKVISALKFNEKKELNMTQEIKELIDAMLPGTTFLSTNVYKCLHLSTRTQEKTASQVLSRMVKDGAIERDKSKDGVFRKIQSDITEIDWENAPTNHYEIALPLGLTDLVRIYPKNIIVFAGTSNAGKTALFLNIAQMNRNNKKIWYFSSEMGAQELKHRLSLFANIPIAEWKKIKFVEQSSNFADVIRPNDLNIIDFMEIHENHYLIGKWIKDIFDKLRHGICLIAIQKKAGQNIGVGGNVTLEKPRLYISVEKDVIKIEKAKAYARRDLNPNGAYVQYEIQNGNLLIPKSGWKKEDFTIWPLAKFHETQTETKVMPWDKD